MKTVLKLIHSQTDLTAQESWWLIEHIFKQTRTKIVTSDYQPQPNEIDQLRSILHEIQTTKKPLGYILGSMPFLDLILKIQPPILIPRPETEEWVELLIQKLNPYKENINTILDIGTGSGCIALALAQAFPKTCITGVDINPQALRLAQTNAQFNHIANATFTKSNLWQNLEQKKFDLIVSNPPYIDPAKKSSISDQVLLWEDHQALFAANQGLDLITQIIQTADQFLTPNNLPVQLILEIDSDQHEVVESIAINAGWDAQLHKDAFKKWRTIWCKKNSAKKL